MSDKLTAEAVRGNLTVVPFTLGTGEERFQIEFHVGGWDFEAGFTLDGRITDISMERADAERAEELADAVVPTHREFEAAMEPFMAGEGE